MSKTPVNSRWDSGGRQQFTGSFMHATEPFSYANEESTPYLSVETNVDKSAKTPLIDNPSLSETFYTVVDPKLRSRSTSSSDFTDHGIKRRLETPVRPAIKAKSVRKNRGPASRETPCFNQETPMILATARHTGSSISISCNTESIRQLQNPYSDCLSTTSSEYFQKKRHVASSNTGSASKTPSSKSSTSTVTFNTRSRSDDTDDLTQADIQTSHSRLADTSSNTTNAQVCCLDFIKMRSKLCINNVK